MIYSNIYKFVYLPIPKTGTSSITKILEKYYDAKKFPDIIGGRHMMNIPSWCESYFKFTIVRSPCNRLLSLKSHLYKYHNIKFDSFKVFMNDFILPRKHWLCANQSEYLRGINVDSILKLENIENFNNLPFINLKHEIPYINKNLDQETFTKEHLKYSILWASEDFVNFNYECPYLDIML